MKKYSIVLALLLLCGVCATRTPAQNPNYVGALDRGDCNNIGGWAADRNRPSTPINVSIFDGTTLVQTVLANGSRGDSIAIGAAVGGGDNGIHAFDIPTPSALKNSQPHSISVRFESTSTQLPNSPKSITCELPGVLPTLPQLVRLNVDFKLNNGAASTKSRLLGLNFSVREVTGATSHDVTSNVTHYRVREEPDSRDLVHDLSAQPWIPFTHGIIMELAERNAEGQRYGNRRVAFQVKAATLTSDVVSDTITLDPVLKEYRVSGTNSQSPPHPLLKYASDQGFTFPLNYYETCKGDCPTYGADSNLASGTALVTVQGISGGGPNTVACVLSIAAAVVTIGIAAPAAVLVCNDRQASGPAGTCVTKADYLLFEGRDLNQFWRIKSVDVSGASVHSHGPNKFLLKFNHSNSDGNCNAEDSISVGDVVMEGPEVDDFIDPANPWKNAFVRPLSLPRPPLVQPGVRPPN